MKITVSNIVEQYPKINVQLPKELNNHEYEFIKENFDLYSKEDSITKYIDTFVDKLNAVLSKENNPKLNSTNKPAEKKKTARESQKTDKKKPAPKKATKPTTRNAKPKDDNPIVPVEHFSLEERIIKRYLLLDGKTKTKDQLLNFIKFLQRSITEMRIRKSSKYADIIIDIQNNLVNSYNALPDNAEGIKFNLAPKKAEELKKIVGNKKVRLSVTYIKRFISLYGKESGEKVKKLLDLIAKAINNGKIAKNDIYFKQVKTVEKALKSYIDKQDIRISDAELKGLAGIAGQSVKQPNIGNPFESTDVVSSLDLQKAVFRHMGFTGIWKKIIGDPEEPFHVMIYGSGGKGKSTFSIKFATYLSKGLLRNVLYIADEEKISGKLKR